MCIPGVRPKNETSARVSGIRGHRANRSVREPGGRSLHEEWQEAQGPQLARPRGRFRGRLRGTGGGGGARPRLFTSDPDRDLRDLRSWAVARCRCAGGTSLRAALFRQVKPLRCCRRTSLASASSDALALQSQLRRHMRLAEHQPGTKIGPALPWGALSAPLVGAACRTRAGGWTEPPHLPLGLFSHWTVTPREEAHLRFVYRPARCWVLALSKGSMTVSWTNGALFSPSSRSVGTRGPSSP